MGGYIFYEAQVVEEGGGAEEEGERDNGTTEGRGKDIVKCLIKVEPSLSWQSTGANDS